MNKFQSLLSLGSADPVAIQRKASQDLAGVVRSSRLRWWHDFVRLMLPQQFALLVIAPYSRYDLALLDILDAGIDKEPQFPLYVASIEHFSNIEDLMTDVPVVSEGQQTPLFAIFNVAWRAGVLSGSPAMYAAGEVVGVSAAEMSRRLDGICKDYDRQVLSQLTKD